MKGEANRANLLRLVDERAEQWQTVDDPGRIIGHALDLLMCVVALGMTPEEIERLHPREVGK